MLGLLTTCLLACLLARLTSTFQRSGYSKYSDVIYYTHLCFIVLCPFGVSCCELVALTMLVLLLLLLLLVVVVVVVVLLLLVVVVVLLVAVVVVLLVVVVVFFNLAFVRAMSLWIDVLSSCFVVCNCVESCLGIRSTNTLRNARCGFLTSLSRVLHEGHVTAGSTGVTASAEGRDVRL